MHTSSDQYLYVFIRQDISIADQLVQSNHAVLHLAWLRGPDEGIPNIVVIGLPNVAALRRAMTKLAAHNIPHYAWYEPDNDFGLTAIATAPIEGEARAALANYRLYRTPVVSTGSTAPSNGDSASSNLAGRANEGMAAC